MTLEGGEGQDTADERLSDAYREAVGSVVAARTLYNQACAAHGPESLAASQANEYLTREIDHRNRLREQYDRVLNRRPNQPRR
ncbi:MAG TPA: hypothetical protein VKX16_03230 [Chloroflexota bacterium]|nr:hypothetical protein [Chloroflexota bacterium]